MFLFFCHTTAVFKCEKFIKNQLLLQKVRRTNVMIYNMYIDPIIIIIQWCLRHAVGFVVMIFHVSTTNSDHATHTRRVHIEEEFGENRC